MATHVSRADEAANYCYADVELQRVCDFGENDTRFSAKTHLGNVLKIDDYVYCYDLNSLNVPEIEGQKKSLPDIIIVKKKYKKKQKSGSQKRRIWKLKHIEKEAMDDTKQNKKQEERDEKDYDEFLEEIEEDPELRSNINLYRDEEAIAMLTKKMDGLQVDESKQKLSKVEEEEKTKGAAATSTTGTKFPRKGKVVKRDTATTKKKKETRKEQPKTKPEEEKAVKPAAPQKEDDDWEDENEGSTAVKLSELLSELTINETPIEVPKPQPVIVHDVKK